MIYIICLLCFTLFCFQFFLHHRNDAHSVSSLSSDNGLAIPLGTSVMFRALRWRRDAVNQMLRQHSPAGAQLSPVQPSSAQSSPDWQAATARRYYLDFELHSGRPLGCLVFIYPLVCSLTFQIHRFGLNFALGTL